MFAAGTEQVLRALNYVYFLLMTNCLLWLC